MSAAAPVPAPPAPPAAVTRTPRAARSSLALFFALIPALVAVPLLVRARFAANRPIALAALLALTWTPAFASLLARRVFREGVGDVSFRLRGDRMRSAYALGIAVPLAVGLIAYGAAWTLGLARFALPPAAPWPGAGAALRFVAFGGSNLVTGAAYWIVLALGEEIGWRGFMLPRMIESRLPWPVLLSGLVWSAWHIPSVLWGGYPAGPSRALSAAIIGVTLTAFAFVLARLRLETGSVWPVVASHAAWNSILLDTFDGATRSPTHWTRETGVLVALASVLVAWLACRANPWPASRRVAARASSAT